MIRPFKPEDTEQVIALWKKAGIYYEQWDKKENLIKKHELQPDLFIVAVEKDKIIGAGIGQYDGWSAYIHHVAVDLEYMEKGIWTELMDALESTLKQKGAENIFLFTFPKDKRAEFFRKRGYKNWGPSDGWSKELE